ncbi:MAG: glycosyltransferase family 2 protein [Thermoleophilaceae bacterium]
MPREPQSAQIALVSLDAPLEPIEVEERHDHVLMIVTLGTTVLGEVLTPVGAVLGIEAQHDAITSRLGERIWRHRLAADFTRATRARRTAGEPSVSVVVCTRGAAGPELTALLDSLVALEPAAHELIVVQSGPNDGSLRAACADYPVRCLDEPLGGLARARNRGVAEATGEVAAFAEPGWVVGSRWLEGLGRAFEDRLVMAVKGYAAPGGHSGEPETYDRIALKVPHLPEGNCFYRREAFVRVGPFAEVLGPGTPTRAGHELEMNYRLVAAGLRVAYRPAHLAIRRPSTVDRRPFTGGVGAGAAATYSLVRRGDFSVLAPAGSALRPAERVVKALGRLAGPFALLWSWLRARGAEPVTVDGRRSTVDEERPAVVAESDPPLSVCVATYNRAEPLANLLGVFAGQSYPPDRFEVVVVVDGSTDGTAERARSLELPYELRVFEQENKGLAASRNRGAHEASAPVLVFIDDDMAPVPDFLAEHAAAHGRAEGPVAALGACPPANSGDDVASLALRHWWEDYYRRRSEPDHQWVYTDFGDGNMSLPRSILEQSGGWDEEFAKSTVRRQDWELAIRLIDAGVRFVDCPGAVAMHHFEADLATSLRNRGVEGRADVLLGTKHPGVREHLFLKRYLVDEKGRERQYGLFADHPELGHRLVAVGARTAQALETLQLRWVAWKAMLRMLSYSYLIGVRETLPAQEQFQDFVEPMLRHQVADEVTVPIDRPGTLELPPMTGAVDLLLTYAGHAIARVEALEPEVQWDWDTLTARVVDQGLDGYSALIGDPIPAERVTTMPAAAPSASGSSGG